MCEGHCYQEGSYSLEQCQDKYNNDDDDDVDFDSKVNYSYIIELIMNIDISKNYLLWSFHMDWIQYYGAF